MARKSPKHSMMAAYNHGCVLGFLYPKFDDSERADSEAAGFYAAADLRQNFLSGIKYGSVCRRESRYPISYQTMNPTVESAFNGFQTALKLSGDML